MAAPLPTNELLRLAELREYGILDTVSEATYDAITYLAAEICDVPIALISIVDEERQWFKSRVGLDAQETHRDLAFCAYAIHDSNALMIVPDAATDVRFQANPLVTGDPNIRFYAGAPLVTPSGNALGTLCVIDRERRELTERQKKSLEALSVQVIALLELRKTVNELARKQEELAAATRQRDTFMATVSHEIRTPLTTVIGYIDLLRSGLPEDERRGVLANVAREAAEVEFLIEDLLVAARAEAASLRCAAVPVRLGAQVAQVLESLEPHESTVEVGAIDGVATADPARVRQIIRNLITNAFRYGGPSVQIEDATAGDHVVLSVIDDGTGIGPEDQEKIFEQFGHATDSRHAAGSVGLGLPIARLLAEKMGGSLTYAYEGERSVFKLSLPAG